MAMDVLENRIKCLRLSVVGLAKPVDCFTPRCCRQFGWGQGNSKWYDQCVLETGVGELHVYARWWFSLGRIYAMVPYMDFTVGRMFLFQPYSPQPEVQ